MKSIMRYACLIVLGLLAGCGTFRTSAPVAREALSSVAVVPFEDLSGHPGAGPILTEQFTTALSERDDITPIAPDTARAALAEKQGQVLPPKEMGKLTGAKTLLLGTVTEYRYKQGLNEEPVIGLTVRLVDAESGRVLWTASTARIGRLAWIRQDSLSRLGQALCRKLVAGLTTTHEGK